MSSVILENRGIAFGKFYIPAFNVYEGDLVVVYLYGGEHYYKLRTQLAHALSGKNKNAAISLYKPVLNTPVLRETGLWKRLFPTRVGTALQKIFGLDKSAVDQLCRAIGVDAGSALKSLRAIQRKQLQLSAAFSKTDTIIFDLAGLGPERAKAQFQFVKNHIAEHGGAAILLDCFDDFQNDCSTFVKVKLQGSE